MWARLEELDRHYEGLNKQIAQPELASDPKQLQALAQQRASIENVITKYRNYKITYKILEETRTMLGDGLDDDMTALVKQEIGSLETQLDNLLQELKLALLPKDANDEKEHAYYCFECLKTPSHDLHITSNRFDEPSALSIASQANIVITLHGAYGKKPNMIKRKFFVTMDQQAPPAALHALPVVFQELSMNAQRTKAGTIFHKK